jgi:hypothetical protein
MATALALAAGGSESELALGPVVPGCIVVFDLDHTIIGPIQPPFTSVRASLNPRVLELLMRLAKIRSENDFIDILLLTNNNIRYLIKGVDTELLALSGELRGKPKDPQFFDFIMDRDHPSRHPNLAGDKRARSGQKLVNPPKFMANVEYMIKSLYKFPNEESLKAFLDPRRIFFVDDLVDHVLAKELAAAGYPGHFIQINPPFTQGVKDETDFSKLDSFLLIYEPKPKSPEVESLGDTASLAELNSGNSSQGSKAGSVAGSTNNSGSENEGRKDPVARQLTLKSKGGAWKHKTSKASKGKKKDKGKKEKGVKGKTAKKNMRYKYRK